jgi:hypothetical protein
MSIFKDLAQGIVMGALSAASGKPNPFLTQIPTNAATDRIEGFCRQLGWTIDERSGDAILLHYKDSIAGIRKLMVNCSDDGKVAVFTSFSLLDITTQNVPAEVTAEMLLRNASLLTGAWQAFKSNNGSVSFVLKYCALVDGLDSSMFKHICAELIAEVIAFDSKMRGNGLL